VKPAGGGDGGGGELGGGVGKAGAVVILGAVAEVRSPAVAVIVDRRPSTAPTGAQPGKERTTVTTSAARAALLLI